MRRALVLLVALVVAVGVVLGLVFAGSPTTIASGVRIDGVDVGGMRGDGRADAARAEGGRAGRRPVVFTAGGQRFAIRPDELGVASDWQAGGRLRAAAGERLRAVAGLQADRRRRLRRRRDAADERAHRCARVRARADRGRVDRPPRNASLALRAQRVVVLPAPAGVALDRAAAATAARPRARDARPLAGPGELPMRVTEPRVRALALAPPRRAGARRALGARPAPARPDALARPPARLAPLLELPSGGEIGAADRRAGGRDAGSGGSARVSRSRRATRRSPSTARTCAIVPDSPGSGSTPSAQRMPSSPPRCARAAPRVATARRRGAARERSRRRRRARWGSTGSCRRTRPTSAAIPNRIHNVELVAHLVDDKLIAPGEEFSFNKTTGERNAAKGFLVAPVIVNGELTTGLGGGVCQVSTTVFNAAFEAGLTITARTNHALYISHYPQGRDATVDYPDVDLKFVNDTDHWLLLRTFVGSVVAHREPVRHADRAEGREHDGAARRPRQGADQEDGRPDAEAGREGRRRSGRAGDDDERDARRVRARTGSSSTTTSGTRPTARRRSSCASGRRRRSREGEEAGDAYDDADDADDSADRIASASQSGTRVGRNVARVDARVRRPAVRHRDAVGADDRVLVAEARAAQADAARVDVQLVVEPGRHAVAAERLEHERLDAVVAQRLVAAGVRAQVLDARDLEPDEVRRVVRDPLRVGVREPHADAGREREAFHGATLRCAHAGRRVSPSSCAARQPCVVLTGAGISTESGIPDFRSPTGIWAQYDPMEYASIDAFLADPAKVWDFYAKRLAVLRDAEPNEGHRALAELEERGWVEAVVTQNIDRLHERAGSRAVVEVHGSIGTSSCLDCGEVVAARRGARDAPAARVPALRARAQARRRHVRRAPARRRRSSGRCGWRPRRGLLLVVGSSLEVYPVAGLPLETLAAGGRLAIVNRGETQFDRRADGAIDAGAGETLAALARLLPERPE